MEKEQTLQKNGAKTTEYLQARNGRKERGEREEKRKKMNEPCTKIN